MATIFHQNASGLSLHESKRQKEPVRAGSTGNVTLATPGATLDGVTLATGDRILLKNQTTNTENGIYVWTGAASALTRSSDADSSADFVYMFVVGVREGTVNAGTHWVFSQSAVFTLDTTAVTFGNFTTGVSSVAMTVPSEFSVAGSPITTSGTLAVTKANQSANQVFAGPTTGSAAAPTFRALVVADLPEKYARIEDQKAQNTAGGTFTSGAWQTRVLNVEAEDASSFVSLASNQITLGAGTYRIFATAPAGAVKSHQARLRDITNNTTLLTGTSEYSSSTDTDVTQTISIIRGQFALAGTAALEVQHQCNTTRATSGFGIPANFTTEVYTVVELWQKA